MVDHCLPLLQALTASVYGTPVNYSTFAMSGPINVAAANQAAEQASIQCNISSDQASIQILQYQAQVLCASTDTFDMAVSSNGNIEGILDMRAIMQCGTCGVLPCLPGQLCDGSGEAAMCPEGYFCPTTLTKVRCPKGKYCPEGSTEPKPCRSIAGSSCNAEGSAREVVWVPLFFAVTFLAAVVLADYLLRRLNGQQRLDKRSSHAFKAVAQNEQPPFTLNSAPVSIAFEDIHLVTNNTVRIAGVTGSIQPGRFTAILGGSGAGNQLTSLLTEQAVLLLALVAFQARRV
jgi:hypothetical protein